MDILVVGSIALDSIKTPIAEVTDVPGGSALYFAGSAGLFAPVNIVGTVGADFDFVHLDCFDGKSVDTKGIHVENGKTFRWGGRYFDDINLRETLFTHLNVFENFKPEIPNDYRESDLIFLANIDPGLQLDVLQQVNNPKLVILDTMNYWISKKRDLLLKVIARSDVLILNDEESKQLVEKQNLFQAAREILKLGPKYLIIKKGEHGALLFYDSEIFLTPAFPLENVTDPTGAGDSFAGGFTGYLAESGDLSSKNIRRAVVYGSTVASFTVEDFSLRRLFSIQREDIEVRIKLFRRLTAY